MYIPKKKPATATATLEIFENSPKKKDKKKGCQKRVTTTRSPT